MNKENKKRVGIDLHVVDGIFQGSRSHVIEIFSRVVSICPDIEFYLFLENIDSLKKISDNFMLPNVHLIHMPHSNPIKRLCVQLPKLQKTYKLDLLHTQYVSPIPSYCKTMITLHDILFESHPQYFSTMFNIRSKILMRLSAARASHIFTVSEFSKKEIISRYHIKNEKISVIYNGVDKSKFYPSSDGIDIINKSGLVSKEYILTVGRLEPRKNHESLIRAYAELDTEFPLVLIGQKHFGYEHIEKLIKSLNLKDKIILLENVSNNELSSYYRHAKLFVYPTWAEGFGMPVIEAMASGVPVITSNLTSLPEVVGDAGILVDPSNILEIKKAMEKILPSETVAKGLSVRGAIQADKFQWSASAHQVKSVYASILG